MGTIDANNSHRGEDWGLIYTYYGEVQLIDPTIIPSDTSDWL
jgi:hypothetical protein